MPSGRILDSPVLRTSTIPPASRLLIRQGGVSDLGGIVRLCEKHAEYWDGLLPSAMRLNRFFERALKAQDDVFQFWVAENGHGAMVGWEMLSCGDSGSGESTSDRPGDDLSRAAERCSRSHVGDPCYSSCVSYSASAHLRTCADARYADARRARIGGLSRSGSDSRSAQTARASRATRVRVRRRSLGAWYALALCTVSDKVPDLGGAMATKRTPAKKSTRKSTKKATKKPAGKRPRKEAAKKRASKAPRKASATRAPRAKGTASRATVPAKPRAKKKAASVSEPVSAPASASASAPVSAPASASAPTSVSPSEKAPSSRPPSYLEGVPQDPAELVSGLFQVFRGAAKDLKTLVAQAIAISNHKNDPYDR